MGKNSLRNRLEKDGFIFRELNADERGGFILRVMDSADRPPKVTTIVQQPGQVTTTRESLLFSYERRHTDTGKVKYAPATPVEAENPGRVLELLRSNTHPLAEVALHRLLDIPELKATKVEGAAMRPSVPLSQTEDTPRNPQSPHMRA